MNEHRDEPRRLHRDGIADQAEIPYRPSPSLRQKTIYAALSGPLKPWQTRLIKLLPNGDMEASLQCEMLVADITHKEGFGVHGLDRYQSYEALSYSWGHPDLTGAVDCNGRIVSIPPAMEDALRYLRLRSDPRWLWCDALCIDQTNDKEKSNQVQTMMDIFAKASHVRVWLGEGDREKERDIAELFKCLRRGKTGPSHTDRDNQVLITQSNRYSRHSRAGDEVEEEVVPELPSHLIEVLRLLSTAQWFERVWCRQEVYAARMISLHVGSHTCPLHHFLNAYIAYLLPECSAKAIIRTMRDICGSHVSIKRWTSGYCNPAGRLKIGQRLLGEPGTWHHPSPRRHNYAREFMWSGVLQRWYSFMDNILYVMQQNRFLKATDPKDRVYALFGMLHHIDDMASDPLVIDYGQTIGEVYGDMTKYLINRSHSLTCLQILRNYPCSRGFPRWAVDWRSDCDEYWAIDQQPPLDLLAGQVAEDQDLAHKGSIVAHGTVIGNLGDHAHEIDERVRKDNVQLLGTDQSCGLLGAHPCETRLNYTDIRPSEIAIVVRKVLSSGAYRRHYAHYLCPRADRSGKPLYGSKPPYGVHVPREAQPGDQLVYFLGGSMVYVVRTHASETEPASNADSRDGNEAETEESTRRAKFIGPVVFWHVELPDDPSISVAFDKSRLKDKVVWRENAWLHLSRHQQWYHDADKVDAFHRWLHNTTHIKKSKREAENWAQERDRRRFACFAREDLTIHAHEYHRLGDRYQFENYILH